MARSCTRGLSGRSGAPCLQLRDAGAGGMTRKILWGLLAVLALGAVIFFGFVPGIVEGSMNKVVPVKLAKPSEAAKQLHASLQIADMHADTLMWRRSLLDRSNTGQVDLPRLQE